MVKPVISGGGDSAVFLMDDFDAAVLSGIFFAYGRAVVCGTIVDQDDFKIAAGRI
jgi:hypothetical protein